MHDGTNAGALCYYASHEMTQHGRARGRGVVITGYGCVSALGCGADPLWDGLREGRSGLRTPTRVDTSGFPCTIAGEIPGFSARESMPKAYRKASKVMARDIEIAVVCGHDAVAHAGLATREHEAQPTTYAPERVGCQIGAGLISAETQELTLALASAATKPNDPSMAARGGFHLRDWGTIATEETPTPVRGMENLQPLWMLKYLPNMLACHVTIIHGCEGPSNTITCAEASGLLSIGEGTRIIERGAADASISGSAESRVNLMAIARMTLAGRLREGNGPVDALRGRSTGGAPGEGGGLLILEASDTATARGATMRARVLGFGAAHARAPLTRANEATSILVGTRALELAIRAALRDADVDASAIDAVVTQGTGALASDEIECGAFRAVLGKTLPPCVVLGPALGDCGAGNGGLAACVGAMMLERQEIPAGSVATGTPRSDAAGLGTVLVVACSQAGQMAALVLGRARSSP